MEYQNTWAGVMLAGGHAGAKFPELVAAQWALESGWGKHTSGKNNYFGLKGQGSDVVTHEYYDGQRVIVTDSFMNFSSLYASVECLVTRWYRDYKGYKGINRAATREEAARLLKVEGYATDPVYTDKLIKLMDDNAPPSESKILVTPDKPLLRITARCDTYLKKSRLQAYRLPDDQKVVVPAGKEFQILKFQEIVEDTHALVDLAYQAGQWHIFEAHWAKTPGTVKAPLIPPLQQGVDWTDFDFQITPYLTVGEVLQWDSRRRPQPGSVESA